jgi:hypothetical protein
MRLLHAFNALMVVILTGCASIGPPSVTADRFDYNTAISNSWKEQTLLNIVKIRYVDMPLFVDVASIVSGYTLESSVNLGGTVSSEGAVQGDFANLGATGKYTDRPTITYQPITGQKFNKSFMTPIPPSAILFMIQTGWNAKFVYPLTVDSVNGIRGRVSGGSNARPGDPKYFRMVELMRKIQKSGVMGMRIIKGKDERDTTVLFLHKQNIPPEIEEASQELTSLLGLQSGIQEVKVRYGLIPKDDTEIAMTTKSMLQIMIELATQINVPPEHVTEGRTVPSMSWGGDENSLISINHSTEKPEDAFVAVKYRDYWFYIDDRHLKSKMSFTFLMILFSVTETGGKESLPLVTIPAG